MINEDNLLKNLYNNSPKRSGFNIGNFRRGSGKHVEYNLFSWITGESEDLWVSSLYMNYYLSKYGLTSQLYYDIVVLDIQNTSDRPKCRYCGKSLPFKTMLKGYLNFCNLSCTAKWGNKVPSKIKNVSKALTGKKLSKQHREALSKGAIRRLIKGKSNGYYNVKKGKYKPNKCQKELTYLSSWELEFMKLCDKDKFVDSIDSLNFSIPYVDYDKLNRNYLADFKVITKTGLTIIVEIKPKRLQYSENNLLKRIAGKKFCYNNSMKYIVLTEEQLFSPTSKNGGFSISDYII